MRKVWTDVDQYIEAHVLHHDPVLADALAAADRAGLPEIAVSAAQGRQLELLARLARARRILEIGTLGGYSTICLARGLPEDGYLLTLEIDSSHAAVARSNLERAQLSARVEVRVGRALETLPFIESERLGPFDVVFIDADKDNNPQYLEWAIRLGRPGTLIIVDNVVRDGRVLDAQSTDGAIRGTRRTYDLLGSHPQLDATVVQTVGSKGYDGFAMALVRAKAPT